VTQSLTHYEQPGRLAMQQKVVSDSAEKIHQYNLAPNSEYMRGCYSYNTSISTHGQCHSHNSFHL